MTGQIVLLNGAPRSGKSSIANAMQVSGDRDWINLGVDVAMATLPNHLRPGLGLRPGGERPDLEPFVARHYAALLDSMAAHARVGLNVVADLGIHDEYSRPLGILADAARRLRGLPVLLVGVRCPLDVIMARRNADPQDGNYETGTTPPPAVQRWEAVHAHGSYDLEIDTSLTSPAEAVRLITACLATPLSIGVFERLLVSPG
jgi:chloramphenicol 3-O phosphotransferase